MKRIELQSSLVKAGTVITWKRHSWFKRFCAFLSGNDTEYNQVYVFTKDIDLVVYANFLKKYKVYIPTFEFTKDELERLSHVADDIDTWNELYIIINGIANTNTFKVFEEFDNTDNAIEHCKYYNKLKNEELGEYIY